MASSALSQSGPQLCFSKNGVLSGSADALMPKAGIRSNFVFRRCKKRLKISCCQGSIPADRVPDMEKRKLMNLLLLGALSLPTTGMLVPYAVFFAPPGSGVVLEEVRSQKMLWAMMLLLSEWLKTHGPGRPHLTLSWRTTQHKGSMLYAPILDASCHSTKLRTSSSALAALSTTTRAV